MTKIYSRKRFIIKPSHKNNGKPFWGYSPNRHKSPNRTFIIKKKTLQILIVLVIAITVYCQILRYIAPVFESLCFDEVKSIATIISNQESTKIMNKYQYDELYTIEKDDAGNIVIIKSNVVPINNMISDLTEAIQNRFNEMENTQINIPMGNLVGS